MGESACEHIFSHTYVAYFLTPAHACPYTSPNNGKEWGKEQDKANFISGNFTQGLVMANFVSLCLTWGPAIGNMVYKQILSLEREKDNIWTYL